MTDTVDILMTYPPDSPAAIAAAQAVQVACDPYWIRGHGKAVRTPGSVVVTMPLTVGPTLRKRSGRPGP
jgi:hypothetical protein